MTVVTGTQKKRVYRWGEHKPALPVAYRCGLKDPRQAVMGLCPGCFNWSVQYTRGGHDPDWMAMALEDAIQEHLLECLPFREIVEAAMK